MKNKIAIIILLVFTFFSCKNDDSSGFSIDLHNGIFVTNEGPFQNGTGTITFISDQGKVTQQVYKKVNNKDLGNIVQSMTLYQNRAFIVVNNSHKVVVVDRYTFDELDIIEGDFIQNPRYFVANNDIGYISNWGNPQDPNDDYISVVSLDDYSLITKIMVYEGPEKMLIEDSKLYVNLQGGFSFNNKVTLINIQTNNVENVLMVGDVPVGIERDSEGVVWVLCQGIPEYAQNLSETSGKLIKIENAQITQVFDFGPEITHPKNLTIDNNTLYYMVNQKVYNFENTNNSLPVNEIDGFEGNFYSLKAKNNNLYATDALDFVSEGKLKVFDLSLQVISNQYDTGLIPGSIVFQD
jgi:hypothetical protein